jgi:hypothetical protein
MLRIRQLNKTYPDGIQEQDVEAEEISRFGLSSSLRDDSNPFVLPSFGLGSERTIETRNRFNGLSNPAVAVVDVMPCGLSLRRRRRSGV